MSTFGLFGLLFLAPVILLISAFVVAKNKQKVPRTSYFLAGLFLSGIGAICLIATYDSFSKNEAFLPLKNAPSIEKDANPFGFITLTLLDIGIGLALLAGGFRAMYRSFSTESLQKNGDNQS